MSHWEIDYRKISDDDDDDDDDDDSDSDSDDIDDSDDDGNLSEFWRQTAAQLFSAVSEVFLELIAPLRPFQFVAI